MSWCILVKPLNPLVGQAHGFLLLLATRATATAERM